MDSFNKIDYRLRPAKHAERLMMMELFRHLRFGPVSEYQYVGFGSVAFIDMKMAHRHLGIHDLVSIEGTRDLVAQQRFEHNKPYNGIDLRFGHSSTVLPQVDFGRRSIVWLDYDGSISRSIANDLEGVARRASSGTFLGVTITTMFPLPVETDAREKELARLKGDFPEFLGDDQKASAFDGGKYAEFARTALGSLIARAVADADSAKLPGARRAVHQICNFRYKDGAPMVTFGWIIVKADERDMLEKSRFESLSFFRAHKEHFRIQVPLVTPMEVREMERRLPALADCTDLDWIPEEYRTEFQRIYRYLPHFGVLEPV